MFLRAQALTLPNLALLGWGDPRMGWGPPWSAPLEILMTYASCFPVHLVHPYTAVHTAVHTALHTPARPCTAVQGPAGQPSTWRQRSCCTTNYHQPPSCLCTTVLPASLLLLLQSCKGCRLKRMPQVSNTYPDLCCSGVN
jgi:hypothetical protein